MKILVLSQYFWPENFRINDLVLALVERGMEVDVLTGKPNYPEGKYYSGYGGFGCHQESWSGATIFRVPLIARGSGGAVRLLLNYLSFIVAGLVFAPWILRRRKYDVIFVYGLSPILQAIPALLLGRMKQCPVIISIQDLWPESLSATGYIRNKYVISVVRSVVRFIYRHADLLLVQSRAFESPVATLAPGKQIEYYPTSVEAVFYALPSKDVPAIPGLEDGFSVVFAGNVGTAQAVETILEAATKLREYSDIHFVVVGVGSRWEWLRQQVETRKLTNLHLPGRYPVDTMPGLLAKADVLLVTLADNPIFAATVPSKVQAYMAVGKPILACLRGEGARLVVEAHAGLAVQAEDAGALADAVVQLFRMTPVEREEFGRNGRRYFEEHFDRDLLVDRLIGYFRSVLPSKGDDR